MDGIEYFQNLGGSNDGWSRFQYQAFGPERHGQHPYAVISGVHQRAEFVPTFADGHSATGGISMPYIRHKRGELLKTADTRPLTSEEQTALDATSHFISGRGFIFPERTPEARRQLHENPHLAPTRLFEESQSPRIKIDRMYADPSMKVPALTLAGMAYEQHNRDTIEASDSLSAYSSRLTKKAMKKGFPVVAHQDNPNAYQTNDTQLTPRLVDEEWVERGVRQNPSVRASTSDEVESGRHAVREMLRGGKTRNTTPVTEKGLSDQFLPGMKEYFQ